MSFWCVILYVIPVKNKQKKFELFEKLLTLMFVLLFSYQKRCDFLEDNVIKKHIFLLYEILQKTSEMESDLRTQNKITTKTIKIKIDTFQLKKVQNEDRE